jgi:hypothetical protein
MRESNQEHSEKATGFWMLNYRQTFQHVNFFAIFMSNIALLTGILLIVRQNWKTYLIKRAA